MSWRPHEVRACSLDDFAAVLEGWAEAHGAAPEMTEDDALDLRRDLGWTDG